MFSNPNNIIIVTGRLVKEPVQKTTQSGKLVSAFTVAANPISKHHSAEYFDCEVWEGASTAAQTMLKKGSLVQFMGEKRTNSQEKDGVKKYFTKFVGGFQLRADGKARTAADAAAEIVADAAAVAEAPAEEIAF